jgi:hypothetical protein
VVEFAAVLPVPVPVPVPLLRLFIFDEVPLLPMVEPLLIELPEVPFVVPVVPVVLFDIIGVLIVLLVVIVFDIAELVFALRTFTLVSDPPQAVRRPAAMRLAPKSVVFIICSCLSEAVGLEIDPDADENRLTPIVSKIPEDLSNGIDPLMFARIPWDDLVVTNTNK